MVEDRPDAAASLRELSLLTEKLNYIMDKEAPASA